MSDIVSTLINDNLVALQPYESARRLFAGGQDWLNANESPYANEYSVDSSRFNRYPSCQPAEVVNAYAQYAGVSNNELIVTRGADEGIELLIRTFCTPGQDNILICPPTYGMYAISAQTCNVGVKHAPLNADFSLDVASICATGEVNLVFICAPNNPTGTTVDADDLDRIVRHFSDTALVVVDEAYIEFDKQNSWADKLADYPNLVILRTLSKAFALAGLRCGFTLANAPVIAALMKVIAPYPLAEPVAQIAAQALNAEGKAKIELQVDFINRQKQWLKNTIAALPGFDITGDTRANFVLFRYAQSPALMAYLVEHGMLIRDQSKQLNLQHCLRVTVGNEAQNQRLIALIKAFVQTTGASA
ncbi:histidinol-phosphate transaminase [Salinimonas sediminis]|uniref:Histidinol-phosphate aminotransferase n=1 Tax=Salinimonas sediminis TaxID=2303538 RepID=A0A346NNK3_9ALTE|nr:histidinol-phosphate transaminase [Salinimonas sediminis]AXR07110.1 histidinol-phosphate transaminase [Salinimonas sediminis]